MIFMINHLKICSMNCQKKFFGVTQLIVAAVVCGD